MLRKRRADQVRRQGPGSKQVRAGARIHHGRRETSRRVPTIQNEIHPCPQCALHCRGVVKRWF